MNPDFIDGRTPRLRNKVRRAKRSPLPSEVYRCVCGFAMAVTRVCPTAFDRNAAGNFYRDKRSCDGRIAVWKYLASQTSMYYAGLATGASPATVREAIEKVTE